jgi:predicted site-specific integrase-resolvase
MLSPRCRERCCAESVIYARVSSSKQSRILLGKVSFSCATSFPITGFVTDVGSGVNFAQRPSSRLDANRRSCRRNCGCPSRDCLNRIRPPGTHIFRSGSVLTIVEDHVCDGCPRTIVMAVLTHFTAKHNGRRSYSEKESTV